MADPSDELRRLGVAYERRRRLGLEDRYAPFEPANLFRMQSLERALARLLRGNGVLPWGARTALDVGCGGGWWLRQLLRWGAEPRRVCGVDALPEALSAARRVHPDLSLARAGADRLPFREASFDLVSQFTVFSSILDQGMRRRAASEMLRVLRPGGLVLWYDFTVNPSNRDTRGVGVAESARLFGGCRIWVERTTLAPPLARLVASRSCLAAELLERIPLLRSHLLMLARKPASSDGDSGSR